MTPFEDRYKKDVLDIQEIWSEEKYLGKIFMIESIYLNSISNGFDIEIEDLSRDGYSRIKEIEAETGHDVTAVCRYMKEGLRDEVLKNSVHLYLTSQDVVSLAYSLMVLDSKKALNCPLIKYLESVEKFYGGRMLMGRTHGQEATPISGQNIIKVIKHHVNQFVITRNIPTRFGNGACGDSFSMSLAKIDASHFLKFYLDISSHVGVNVKTCPSRQTDYYTYVTDCLYEIHKKSVFLKNEAKNMWLYCMTGDAEMLVDMSKDGSSAMPQKNNPIAFENAEANFHMSQSMCLIIIEKLGESRLDRDLSDLSVLRNLGLVFAYFKKGVTSLTKGMDSVVLKPFSVENFAIFAEYLNIEAKDDIDSYDKIKDFFKGRPRGYKETKRFVSELDVEKRIKNRIIKNLKTFI